MHFPYDVVILVYVERLNNTIKCTVVNEGATTYVMYMDRWKGLFSCVLSKLMTMLIVFDVHSFQQHVIIPSL